MKRRKLTRVSKNGLLVNLKARLLAMNVFRQIVTVLLIVATLSATFVLPDRFVPRAAAQSNGFGLCPDASGILQVCELQTRGAAIEMTNGAINDVLAFYQLPESERANVMKNARSEVRAMLYRRFIEIINKENRTSAEEDFVSSFELYLQDLRKKSAVKAREEYYQWETNACNGWQPPAPFEYDPGAGCNRFNSIFTSGPKPPTFEEFQQMGAAFAYQGLNTPEASGVSARTAQSFGVGIGAGLTAVGGAVGAAFGSTIPFVVLAATKIIPFATAGLAKAGSITAASASGALGAGVVGGAAAIIIATIAILVVASIDVTRQSQLPGKLLAAVNDANAVPNLRNVLNNEAGAGELYAAFILATMPDFTDASVPAPLPSDRQFVVKRLVPNGAPVVTEGATISYLNWEWDEQQDLNQNPLEYTNTARVSGNWFVEKRGNIEKKVLAIEMLDGQTARRVTVTRFGGKFLISDVLDPNRTKLSDEFTYLAFVPNIGPAQFVAKMKAEQIEVSTTNALVACSFFTPSPDPGNDQIIGAVNGSTELPANLVVKVNGGTSATVNNLTLRNLSVTSDYKIKANVLATSVPAPTTADFNVSVINTTGQEKTDAVTVKLTAVINDFALDLPTNVDVGSNYSADITTSGERSCSPATYSVSDGDLPAGTRLVTDSFGAVRIEGTLVAGGKYDFTVMKSYENGEKIFKNYTIAVRTSLADLTNNVKSWWRAEENSDDFTARANGTVVGNISFADGMVNRAFRFDGSNSYVKLPDETFSPSLDFTFETWFKTASRGVILGRQRTAEPYENPQFGATPAIYVDQNGKLRVQMFQDQNNQFVTSGTRVDDNRFHHVAVVYRRGTNTRTVYVDGVNIGSTTGVQEAAPQKYQIGTGYVFDGTTGGMNGWFNFKGLIDDAALYDRELSAQEIAQIVRAGKAGKISVNVLTQAPSARNLADGALFIDAKGGTPGLSYTISGGNITSLTKDTGSFVGLRSGNYEIVVKDGAGNTITRTTTIINPTSGLSVTPVLNSPTCSTTTDGSIYLVPSGLTGDAQFSVRGGQNAQSTNVFVNLGSGTYTPWVYDINSDTVFTGVSVNLIAPAPFSVSPSNFTNAALNQPYSRTFTVTGGTPPFAVTASGTNAANGNALPAGLSATADGNSITISGTPQQTGTFQIRLGISDQNTCFESRTFPLTITSNQTYAISGKVTNGGQGMANVTVSYSDGNGAEGSAVTDAAGNYSLNSLSGGASYTLTAQLNDQTFSPATLVYNNLNANITNANFATAATTYEGDIAGRPSGDGAVNVIDLVTLGRVLSNLDAPFAAGAEYQRADIAPRTNLGNGTIDQNDLTQLRNYIVGNNPLTPSGGAIAAIDFGAKSTGGQSLLLDHLTGQLVVSKLMQPDSPLDSATIRAGTVGINGGVFVPITLESSGGTSAVQFTLTYDSSKLTLVSASNVAPPGTTIVQKVGTPGQISVVAHQPLNGSAVFPAGSVQLLRLNFSVVQNATGSAAIGFTDMPTARFAADAQAGQVTLNSANGAVVITAPPTAAMVSISGQVVLPQELGSTDARVTLTDMRGNARTMLTRKFGSFRFTDVAAGETYIVTAFAKRRVFAPQVISVTGDVNGLIFTAQ